jgi:hypothetical protein
MYAIGSGLNILQIAFFSFASYSITVSLGRGSQREEEKSN